MSDEEKIALAKLATSFDDFVERYNRDRDETKERYRGDRERQDGWRQSIEDKVDALGRRIEPIARDHQTIMLIAKWSGAGFITAGAAWAWKFLEGHLK